MTLAATVRQAIFGVALAIAWACLPLPVNAAPGDVLYVQGDKVNVRAAPTPTAAVKLQLDRGHQLLELERRGEWINVGIESAGGKDGWIHGTLVGPQFPGGGSTAPADPKFARFRAAVAQLNAKVQVLGYDFFPGVENLGDGIVRVAATETWLSAPLADRQSNLETLFALWDAADGTGLPIAVQIVDGDGCIVMQKARR